MLAGQESLRAGDGPSAGPLVDRFPLTLEEGSRIEAVGPFFYSETNESVRTWAVPPLMSRLWDPVGDYVEFNVAYPILTYRRFGTEFRWQLVQVLSFSGSDDQQQTPSRRFTLFPVYFQQRSPDRSQDYTALVPFYGHLKNRLFRDEIFFVMFPIYGQSRKKDVVTDNYLYPFFALRHGDALRGWQVWPLVGHEHKDPTTRTNGFGDREVIGGHDSLFALWPLFWVTKSGIGTPDKQEEHALLPFYSSLRSSRLDTTILMWPLITHMTDREKHYSEWETPWPLVVFARGEGKTTSRVWPFYSKSRNANLESGFVLWPIFKYNRVHADPLDGGRTRILFFLYSNRFQKNTETGEVRRRVDLWPLFTHRREFNGSTRLQWIAPLEPFLPSNPSIERDYSPLWSIWRVEKDPRRQTSSQSLFWNLYRRDTTADSSDVSCLFGLFRSQSGPAGRRVRLFYIPFGASHSANRAGSEPGR